YVHAQVDTCSFHSFPTRRSSDLSGLLDAWVNSEGAIRSKEERLDTFLLDEEPQEALPSYPTLADVLRPSGDRTGGPAEVPVEVIDRKSTRLNSSHLGISYAVFCL